MEVKDQVTEEENSRALWASPWKYKESIIIVFLILLGGIALEVLSRGHQVRTIAMPYNIYMGFTYISLLVIFHLRYKNWPLTRWLSSIPAALSAISLFAIMVLILGFLPQDVPYNSLIVKLTGVDHVKTSWLFLVTQLFFLTTLAMVIIRRAFPLNGKNIGFFLNHAGLFLTLTAATLGAGDIKRLDINLLKEGNESNIGVSGQGDIYKLPFSLQLLDFYIEEYNPRLGIIDSSGQFVDYKGKAFPMAAKGLKTELYNWKIEVLNYLPHAVFADSAVHISDETGNCPAAQIIAINIAKKDTIKGWVLSGSYLQEPLYLALDTANFLVLAKPEPKKYRSTIVVRTDSIKTDTVALEVNKPFMIKGWKIYQVSYDQSKGKWSSLSILEAVNDPWLPAVYTGFFMMMAGAVLLFWLGKTKISGKNTDN